MYWFEILQADESRQDTQTITLHNDKHLKHIHYKQPTQPL